MIWPLLASVLCGVRPRPTQQQIMKHEQAMNDSKNKADTLRVCRR